MEADDDMEAEFSIDPVIAAAEDAVVQVQVEVAVDDEADDPHAEFGADVEADDEVGAASAVAADDEVFEPEAELVVADAATDAATDEVVEPEAPDHLALVADAERTLDAVDRAMARLREGTYGTCEICGDALGDADLQADPTAERCGQHLPLAHSA